MISVYSTNLAALSSSAGRRFILDSLAASHASPAGQTPPSRLINNEGAMSHHILQPLRNPWHKSPSRKKFPIGRGNMAAS